MFSLFAERRPDAVMPLSMMNGPLATRPAMTKRSQDLYGLLDTHVRVYQCRCRRFQHAVQRHIATAWR